MPGAIETAYIELRADDTKFRREANASAKDAGDESGGHFGRKFVGALAAAGAGVAVGAFFKTAITGASDLNESINAVNVSFDDNAAGILALSEEAATGLGLTATQFNGMAVQFQGFAKNIAGEGGDVVGTIDDLSTRAADFASVMNLDVGDAVTVFQSGLAGETEALRRYGIDVSAAAVETFAYENGIAAAGEELTEAQKQQARYGLIMQETSEMQGDFAKTSEGLANGLRILKANASEAATSFGAAMLPALSEAVVGINEVVGGLEQPMAELGESFGGAITPLIDALGPTLETALSFLPGIIDNIGGIFGNLAPLIEPVVGLFGALGEIVFEVLGTAFDALGPVIDVVAKFLGDLGAMLSATLMPAIERMAPLLEEIGTIFADVLAEVLPEVVEVFEQLLDAMLPLIEDGLEIFVDLLTTLEPVLPEIVKGLILLKAASVAMKVAQLALNLAMRANPMVLIGTALAALAFAVFKAYQRFEGFRNIVDQAWQKLQEVWDWLSAFGVGVWEDIQVAVDRVMDVFGNFDAIVSEVVATVKAALGGDFSAAWEHIQEIVSLAVEGVQNVVREFGPKVLEGLGDFGGILLEWGKTAWANIRVAADYVWDNFIWPFLRDLPARITTALGPVGALLWWAAKEAWQKIRTAADYVWDNFIWPFLEKLPGRIADGLAVLGDLLWWSAKEAWKNIKIAADYVWDNFIGPFVEALPGRIVAGLENLGALLWWAAKEAWKKIKIAADYAWDNFIWPFVEALPGRVSAGLLDLGALLWWAAKEGWKQIKVAADYVWDNFIWPFVEALPGRVVAGIANLGPLLWWGAKEAWKQIKFAADYVWDNFIWRFVEGLPGNIADGIVAAGSGLWTKGQELLLELWSGIEVIWGQLETWAGDVPGMIGDWIIEKAGDLLEAGGTLMSNIVQGIEDWARENIPGAGWLLDRLGIGGLSEEDGAGIARPVGVGFFAEMERQVDEAAIVLSEGGRDAVAAFEDELSKMSMNLPPGAVLSRDDIAAWVDQFANLGVEGSDRLTDALFTALGSDAVLSTADWNGVMAVYTDELAKAAEGADTSGATSGLSMGFGLNLAADMRRLVHPIFDAEPDSWAGKLKAKRDALRTPGSDLIDGLKGGLDGALLAVRVTMLGLSLKFVQWLGDLKTTFKVAGLQLIGGLAAGMQVGLIPVTLVLMSLRSTLVSWLGDTRFILYAKGVELMNGLTNGVYAGRSSFANALGGLGGLAYNAVGYLGNALYSRGVELIDGLIRGTRDRIARLEVRAVALMSFATGGIVPGAGPQMAVVHGGELILNAIQQTQLAQTLSGLGSNVLRWQGVALNALRYTAQSARWLGDLLTQMKMESGGNPNAVNRWDSNWKKGTPSMGLMQTIGPTFRAFARELVDRGIFDPFANIVAAIRYTLARYGDLGAWRRRGFRGYEFGGMVPGYGPQLAVVHGGERVLTPEQQRAFGPTFGAGAIQVTFAGALPTDGQAYQVGRQVGQGIEDELERQRVRHLARTA